VTALQLGSGPVFLVGGLLLVVAAVTVSQAFEVVNAYEKRALTVFGEYRTTLEPGINVVPPFVSETTSIDMRSQRATLSVETATADRASARVEAVVDVAVTDAERAFLETDDYRRDTLECADSSLRSALGEVDGDALREDPADVADRVRRKTERRTAGWGIEVEGVELTEVAVTDGPGAG